MKIILIGQSAFGKAVMEAILAVGNDSLTAVFCPPDRSGGRGDPLKEAAELAGLNIYQFRRLRSPEAISKSRELSADLCIMAFVTDIVPPEIISAPVMGTIQYHPSLLPKHRGPSSINWPIINGECSTGLTIFWPDSGLDTGPILLQREVAIGPDDTVGSIYFSKLFPMGVQGLLDAIDLVRTENAPRTPQDESQATYEGWCRLENAGIQWQKQATEIHNLIRGCDPQPGAYTTYKNVKLQLYDTRIGGTEKGVPGTILSIEKTGVEIATGRGSVIVKRIRHAGGSKIPALEYANKHRLRLGDTLETPQG